MHHKDPSSQDFDFGVAGSKGDAGAADPEAPTNASLWALNPVSRAWQTAWDELQQQQQQQPAAAAGRACDDSVRCRVSGICDGAAACVDDSGMALSNSP